MFNTSVAPLQITVNAEPRSMAHGARLSDLVSQLQLDPRKVAIERNLAIVPRSQYAETTIMDGDAIEIVGFIGGG